ncbi:MAG: hypothetical protein ACO2XZ_05045 [Rickettsiales bacterium]
MYSKLTKLLLLSLFLSSCSDHRPTRYNAYGNNYLYNPPKYILPDQNQANYYSSDAYNNLNPYYNYYQNTYRPPY